MVASLWSLGLELGEERWKKKKFYFSFYILLKCEKTFVILSHITLILIRINLNFMLNTKDLNGLTHLHKHF